MHPNMICNIIIKLNINLSQKTYLKIDYS